MSRGKVASAGDLVNGNDNFNSPGAGTAAFAIMVIPVATVVGAVIGAEGWRRVYP